MKNLFKALSIVLFGVLIFSCSDDDDDNTIVDDNNLGKGEVEIKSYPDRNNNRVSFFATVDKITIDWGDGSVDELTPNGVYREFTHEYANPNFRTIKINTEAMTYIRLDYASTASSYNELRIGNCPNLKEINSSGANLAVLSIKSAPALTSVTCVNNDLATLDLSGCTALRDLNCSGNQLASLNVSGCAALRDLNCFRNQLTSLNVSGCTALTYLDCSRNQLTSLDVSKCTELLALRFHNNQLTSLDVSKCTTLAVLDCSYNQFTGEGLNSLFDGLHSNEIKSKDSPYLYRREVHIYNNPGANTCDRTIATSKGWEVIPLR